MGFYRGPNIVTDGLVLALDAASTRSYPGSGSTWSDLSGNSNDFTIDSTGLTYNTGGWFDMVNGGINSGNNITDATACTFVFWIRTTDAQALFWSNVGNSVYLGAYKSTNKFYNDGFGTPTLFMNTVSRANIYDFIRTNEWIMLEFKNVNMSQADTNNFNKYSSYTFGNGDIAIIRIYNRTLTAAESQQNFNAQKSRFGL